MKPVWIVQCVYQGDVAALHHRMQVDHGGERFINGQLSIYRSKASADRCAAELRALGEVNVKRFMRPESADEAFMALIGAPPVPRARVAA